jgi:hypothetical protein
MPGVLDKVMGAWGSVGSKIATAPNSEAEGIKARQEQVKSWNDLQGGKPEPPKAEAPMNNADKIHPNSKYGDRPGEKRIDVSSYAKGTTKVPKTGLAVVHKGEAIIPAKENPMNKGGMDAVMGLAKDKAPKKEIKEMVHSKSHNGKHIVVHRHHSPAHHPDETHVMNSMDELHSHLEDHAGTPNEGEAAPAAGAEQPAPLTAAPSPAPAPAGM